MRLNPDERFDVDQAMNHHWMKENSPSLTPPDALSTTPNEGTPSSTPIDSQDLLPPPVNHSYAKKCHFNPVFWSIRRNRSATLNGDLMSAFDHTQLSQMEQTPPQSQLRSIDHHTQAATVAVINDEIDEFSSDEESKPSANENSGKKSTRSRSKSKFDRS
jgi:hypothetical protein